MDLELDYHPLAFDYFLAGQTHIQSLMLSAQYNGEKLILTGDSGYRWNRVREYGVIFPDNRFVRKSRYVRDSYQLFPELQAAVCSDVIYRDMGGRNGSRACPIISPPTAEWPAGAGLSRAYRCYRPSNVELKRQSGYPGRIIRTGKRLRSGLAFVWRAIIVRVSGC
jgi:hypothetical protein